MCPVDVPCCSRHTDNMKNREISDVGKIVADRRVRLQMDATALALAAGVDVKTLRSLERGERWPRESSRIKLERALQWDPGSLDSLLNGGEAMAVDGLAAVDGLGEELFYLNGRVDVAANGSELDRNRKTYNEVKQRVSDIYDTMQAHEDATTRRAEVQIRAVGRFAESASRALGSGDFGRAIADLEDGIEVTKLATRVRFPSPAPGQRQYREARYTPKFTVTQFLPPPNSKIPASLGRRRGAKGNRTP